MKVIGDVSSFLKRTAGALTMQHDGKVFIVKYYDISARSHYLDDALESIAEETRRRANGMQTMRESKSEPVASAPLPPQKPPFQGSPSISTAGQVAYQQQAAAYPKCPSCGKYPYSGTSWIYAPAGLPRGYVALDCKCGIRWRHIPTTSTVYKFEDPDDMMTIDTITGVFRLVTP